MDKILEKCIVCPHKCGVNRLNKNVGMCGASDKVKVACSMLHFYEEPCISGTKGSGTVFFSNCNLKCIYCQNYEISQLGKGQEISIEELAELFLTHQENGAHNINLVTPTIYVPQIVQAIDIAKNGGLNLPIIYNSNGYESVDTLKLLEGYIDVYLPDMKYFSNELGLKYSKVSNYFDIASLAICEMYRQVGSVILNENGIIKKGVIIRHLVLPNHIDNTKLVLNWIKDTFGDEVYVSLMAQYFPTYLSKNDEKISRKLSKEEYSEIENYLFDLELENGYIQKLGEHEEEYVPNFSDKIK
ncbi:MAG: radical SAM protein [Clostridia bacterium]|nr:radical SAM protein [Clostridia bacterium]